MTGFTALVVVLTLCGASALTAILRPLVLVYLNRANAPMRFEAVRQARFSGFIIACALARMANLSFAGHALNVVANAAVVVCAGWLVAFALDMRPRFVQLPVALLAGLTWIACLLFCLANVVLDDSPATVQLENGLVCHETVYGFVTGDSGEVMDVYRRYLFIDHRIHSQTHSDVDPALRTPSPPELSGVLARCQVLVDAKRRAASR